MQNISEYYTNLSKNTLSRLNQSNRAGAFFVNIHEGENTGLLKTLEASKEKLKNTILIGIAGELNLNILAASRIKGALIGTPDLDQTQMWERIIELIKRCPTPEAFKSFWSANIKRHNNFEFFKPDSEHQFITRSQQDPNALWLQNENYAYIRQLIVSENLKLINLDLLNKLQCEQLGKTLLEHKTKVGIFYASNLIGYYAGMGQTGQGYLGDPAPQNAEEMTILAHNIAAITNDKAHYIIDGSFKSRRIFENTQTFENFIRDVFTNREKYKSKPEKPPKKNWLQRLNFFSP